MLFALWSVLNVVLAQEEGLKPTAASPDEGAEGPAAQDPAVGVDVAERLEADAALVQLQAELNTLRGESSGLGALVAQASILLDDRALDSERIAAATALAAEGDSRSVAFIRGAGMSRNTAVQTAAITAIPAFGAVEAASLGVAVLRVDDTLVPTALGMWGQAIMPGILGQGNRQSDSELRAHVMDMLVALQDDEAAHRLWLLAGDAAVSDGLREGALNALEEGYAEWLSERGNPDAVSGKLGTVVGVVANGVAGGHALHAVGVWGQTEAGEVIGGLGGTAIGLGTGALYVLENPVSDGQGVAYGSAVGLGGVAGYLAGFSISGTGYGSNWRWDETPDRRDLEAALRLAGIGGGAWYGFKRMENNPSLSDVLELDALAYFGAQLAVGLGDMARDHRAEDWGYHYDYNYDYGYGGEYEVEWEVREAEVEAAESRDLQIDSALGLVGMAAGLGVGHRIVGDWQPGEADVGLAAVAATQGGILAGLLPVVIHGGYEDLYIEGHVRTGIHAAGLGALYYAHRHEIDNRHVGIGAYSMAVGNALGAGIPMALMPLIDRDNEERALALGLSTLGVAGTVAGVRMADHMVWSRGDMAMIGVGLSLALWESTAYAFVADEKWNLYKDSAQIPGTILVATGATGLGLAGLAHKIEPDPANMLFLGTATAWGAYYGALVPIALETEGSEADYVLTILAASDIALGLAAWAVSKEDFLDPRDTLITQLGGVGGATLGALAASMASEESSNIASGALIGATAGMVAGSFGQRWRASNPVASNVRSNPRSNPLLNLPGDWSVNVLPIQLAPGEMGTWMGIQVDRW
ncbi:MAG: hypothetical protein VX519_12930 [Myxococcota bacterium]|nr:hypothetical protein [Myxococcota bacterium]